MATNEMITIDQLTEILKVLPSSTYTLVNENGVTKKIKLENLINKTLSEVQVLEIEGVPTKNKTLKGALAELSTQIEENKINFVEDDTSIKGIDDTVHDTLETEDKRIIGGINEVNRKVKDVGQPTQQQINTAIDKAIEEGKITGTGGGINSTAKTLLETILRNAIYTADQSANITSLVSALSSGSTPSVTYYIITSTLTNCTNNNSNNSVAENTSYIATITPNTGYKLDTVTVTMGGKDVTSTVYSNGKITINSVTGDIVITATAIEKQAVAELPTNG